MTSIEESYIAATVAKSLQPGRPALDLVAAAGMAMRDEPLGLMLVRLRGEYDRAKGAMRATEGSQKLAVMLAKAQDDAQREAKRMKYGPTRAGKHQDLAGRLGVTLHRLAHAQWISASLRMATLPAAQTAVLNLGQMLCERVDEPPRAEELQRMCAGVLHWWLDPVCPSCSGTGGVGDFGTIRRHCPSCHGSGAREFLPAIESQTLATALLALLERKSAAAMAKLLHTYRGTE